MDYALLALKVDKGQLKFSDNYHASFQVPITTFLLTQPYFLLYHTISNMTLRRLSHAIKVISYLLILL
jgi:hypothetical protein